jgi:hypothetical protein
MVCCVLDGGWRACICVPFFFAGVKGNRLSGVYGMGWGWDDGEDAWRYQGSSTTTTTTTITYFFATVSLFPLLLHISYFTTTTHGRFGNWDWDWDWTGSG